MNEKEIILAKIAESFNRKNVIFKKNGEIKSRLKCSGLNVYYEKNSEYLEPYVYNKCNGREYENDNIKYSLFLGLDYIFSELYVANREEDILNLLKELVKSINYNYLKEYDEETLQEIKRLYSLLGLNLKENWNGLEVSVVMNSSLTSVKEQFSVETWLKEKYIDIYNAYEAAIDSYTSGYAGACIESCRTVLTSLFTFYKGKDGHAKWVRGLYNLSEDIEKFSIGDLSEAIKTVSEKDLAKFFNENESGKLTKTRTIYMIYSMFSDYGTHRGEGTKENPTLNDALFMLRLTDSILFWVYSMVE